MKILRYWVPVLLWASVIFSFSTMQVTPGPEFHWQDFILKKTAHLVEYAILFVLFYRALLNTTSLSKINAALIAFGFAFFYGLSDEFHQSFTPGREPNFRDVVIDTIGGGLAWLGIWRLLPKAPKKLKNLAKNFQII